MHESNGLGIITALILNDINPLGKVRMDLVLELRNNASKLLLAIMESRSSDPENVAEKIIYNMNPKQLIDVASKAYHQEILDEDDDDEEDANSEDDGSVSPKEVGHNIYILCHQLALYNREIHQLLKTVQSDPKVAEALRYYSSHTAQIEVVRHDRTLEQVSAFFGISWLKFTQPLILLMTFSFRDVRDGCCLCLCKTSLSASHYLFFS